MRTASLIRTLGSVLFLFTCLVVGVARADPSYQQHVVGSDWQWFTDYAFFTSDWTVNVEPNCPVEVASGLMVHGHPWGSTHQFTAYYKLTAYGAGAIHVRSIRAGQRCTVRVDMGDVSPIPIYSSPNVLPAAIDAGKKVIEAKKDASQNQIPPPSK